MKTLILPLFILISLSSCAQQKSTTGSDILKKAGGIFGKKEGEFNVKFTFEPSCSIAKG